MFQLSLKNIVMFYLTKKWDKYEKKIESKLHKLGTYEGQKLSLSCFDDTS